ncbi:hypothetical protein CASFOL_010288 [Castilleja foliolosa]|uniref:BHLH domain-containing protein n=1 Tax=Castilleja foliolosa TaxID=1961234 RepID=A0ABD3DSP3_9LAMI
MNNNHQQQQQFQQNMQTGSGSGLTRYRSAPSSYFATLLSSPSNDDVFGGDDLEHLFNPRASGNNNSTETVRENSSTTNLPSQSQLRQLNSQFLPPRKAETQPQHQQQLQRQRSNDFSSGSQMVYQSHNSDASNSTAAIGNSYGGLSGSGSVSGSFDPNQLKMERVDGVGNFTLIRHSSSPAGLFANIDIENELGTMRAMWEPSSSSSASRFKKQMNFSSRHSSSGMMNTIPEFDIKGENITTNRQFDESHVNDVDYITGLPMNTWDESDDFFKRLSENDSKRFSSGNAVDDQSNEGVNRPPTRLSHHLSLPTSSSELSAMEKQDSVPCKIRAKRGFATHPRSIAERVRRTKISERIRKLQELVPNMDKQTNTSDMLDLAVDYIKDLQRQLKTLSDNRAKCSCSAKHNS